VYFMLFAVYVVLELVFIVDVLRRPASQLSAGGKALWILALLVAPVFAWIVYGFWRMRQTRAAYGA
jgi:hypothetical protein